MFSVTSISDAPSARSPERKEPAVDAYDLAVRLLAGRAMSSGGLRQKLRDRDIPADEAAAAVERLQAEGYLDDAAFAAARADGLVRRKGVTGQALRVELERAGVDADAAAAVAASAAPSDDAAAEELAFAAIERRIPGLARLSPEQAERRLQGFLQRRGHHGAPARAAIERALQQAFDG